MFRKACSLFFMLWIVFVLWLAGCSHPTKPSEEAKAEGVNVESLQEAALENESQESTSNQEVRTDADLELPSEEPQPVEDGGTVAPETINPEPERTNETSTEPAPEPRPEASKETAAENAAPDKQPPRETPPEQPAEKPPVGPNQCTTEQTCQRGLCYYPGQFLGCGRCRNPSATCQSDSSCKSQGSHYICANKPSFCHCSGQTICTPGCQTNSECKAWQTCQNNRCQNKSCQANTDCPANFFCSKQQCARIRCSQSSQCSGYCVKGQCYNNPGTCSFPPP